MLKPFVVTRSAIVGVALGNVLLACALLVAISLIAGPDAPVVAETAQTASSDMQVSPPAIRSCEITTVTHRIETATIQRPLDIFFLIDGSGSWPQENRTREMLPLIEALLDEEDAIDARVGIIMHHWVDPNHPGRVRAAGVIQRLSSSLDIVSRSWRRIYGSGGEWPTEGLLLGTDELIRARNGRPETIESIMVLTGDGGQFESRQDLASAGDKARGRGMRVMSFCFVEGPDCFHYAAAVAVADDHIEAQRGAYDVAVSKMTTRIMGRAVTTATLEHRVSQAFRVRSTSIRPPASWESAEGNRVRWHYRGAPPDSITVTYALEPQVDVFQGAAVDASLAVTDDLGVMRVISADSAGAEITGPCAVSPTPTPTSTSTSTPTHVPSRTPSSTPTHTTTPTPTPSPVPKPLYLPLALTESCDPTQVRIDVALVIDASSSMREPAGPGRAATKLDAALQAVGSFLDILALDAGDQAAIVSFSSDAWLHAGLTADRAALDAALAAVEPGQQTRLDRGIEVGTAALMDDATRDPDNEPVLIVLTDGRANPVPVDVAVERADDAKVEGVTIFTIGLGEDLEVEALRSIASEPAFYLHAPTAGELAGVYAEVARSIPCPPSAYWGGR